VGRSPTLSVNGRNIAIYSDLMLHDLGSALDVRVVQGEASGKEWRTSPLWALSSRDRLLHDGRATTIEEAILAHDGEAASSTKAFRHLDWQARASLLQFLSVL